MLPPSAFDSIKCEDYSYALPSDRIAVYPLANRESSRLLMLKDGIITEDVFSKIASYLPASSLMVLNETRVVQARLNFVKPTGAKIEVFCLEPLFPSSEVYTAFSVSSAVRWRCLVGNARKWKSENLRLPLPSGGELIASRLSTDGDTSEIEFSWTPAQLSFGEVLEMIGHTPLPPYLHRKAEEEDKSRYQTVFARNDGSVAAPTAGLHFTDAVFQHLNEKGIRQAWLSLHVGAGTFKPLGEGNISEHRMHSEQMSIPLSTIETLKENPQKIIAVGTTSVRTLESLYWFGVKLSQTPDAEFRIGQWESYALNQDLSRGAALENVIRYCHNHQMEELRGITTMMIVPSYKFKMTDVLITNFHQPRSTLLLLVAAFAGSDWRKAYEYAINNNFRMLSYGDSCLFYPSEV